MLGLSTSNDKQSTPEAFKGLPYQYDKFESPETGLQPDDPQIRPRGRRNRFAKRFHLLGFGLLCIGLLLYATFSRVRGKHSMSFDQDPPPYSAVQPTNPPESTQSKFVSFTFDKPSQFSFRELVEPSDTFLMHVRGTLTLASDLSDQDSNIQVDVSMTSYNIDIEETKFQKTENSLEINTPQFGRRHAFWRVPYVVIDVVVHVANGVNLNQFEASTRHLNVEIKSDLAFSVADWTSISAVSGHVHCDREPKQFSSRDKSISTVSGSIKGEYGLEDLLSISSKSGGIHVVVVPKAASKTHPDSPAVFSMSSTSGGIEANFETANLPERDYQVEVKARSGSTRGTYVHGSKSSFASTSGSMEVSVIPSESNKASVLTSDHTSGSTRVTVKAPIRKSGSGALNRMQSTHRTVSGSLRVYYPSEWEGMFKGSSVSGSLSAEGPGLTVERGDAPGRKSVAGSKGDGADGRLEYRSVSGSAQLRVG